MNRLSRKSVNIHIHQIIVFFLAWTPLVNRQTPKLKYISSYHISSYLFLSYQMLSTYVIRAELDMTDCDGKTALHLSCSEGHYDVVVIVTLEAGKIR